ncbi:MAG: DUF4124 domain-containing protein [Povalibacter sp.]
MRTTLFLLVLLAGPVFAGQTVWKWVDADGVTHYSDRPVPGATRMELSTGSSAGDSTPSSSYGSTNTSPADAGPPYRNFEIWKPGNDENIVNTGGQVTVNVRIEPSVQPGHTLSLYLDGRLIEGSQGNSTSFELPNVPRGTHSVTAVVTDGNGRRVQETGAVTFHVRQESTAQPPVGPALRPPPKPQPRAGNKMQTSQPTYVALNSTRTKTIDPATNRPVVAKPSTSKPTTPGPHASK